MAKPVPTDLVIEALGQVKYPGYDSDIITLGMVEDVSSARDGAVSVTVRQATDRSEVMQELAARIHHKLSHELGLEVELKARRIDPELGEKTGRMRLDGVRRIIAVASGKGGVGKSTVAANIAVALSKLGLRVGLLDADIYGPSMAMMFGTGSERPKAEGRERFHPIQRHGVSIVSMGFFLTDKTPVIWRGPMVMGAVRQFLKDVVWGPQDFLIVDLPPGTGDAQLTLAQQVSLDGAIIVTTPQNVALLDALRALKMFRQVNCPVLGVVENMSFFVCPDCGERDEIFGQGGGQKLADQEHLRLLARLPLYPEVRAGGDRGVPIAAADSDHPASRVFSDLAKTVIDLMPSDDD